MKISPVVLISLIVLFSSCERQGDVSGTVVYFSNDKQEYKPDVGANIYITKLNCDTIRMAIEAYKYKEVINSIGSKLIETKEQIKRDKKNGIYYGDYKKYSEALVESSEKSIDFMKSQLSRLCDDIGINPDSLINYIYTPLINIDKDERTYKNTVNVFGNYSLRVPIGEYNIIIESKRGLCNIDIKNVCVKSNVITNSEVKFENDY